MTDTAKATYIEEVYGVLRGKTIAHVRPMKDEEMTLFGWTPRYGSTPMIIILDDGTAIIPSSDPEGNEAGHLFVEATE
jgi:hypothetical protein